MLGKGLAPGCWASSDDESEACMIYVTKIQWDKLEEVLGADDLHAGCYHEHDGKVCLPGERMIRLSHLTGKQEDCSTLVFEHIHFEVVDRIHRVKVRRRTAV